MAVRINKSILADLTRRVDKDKNNRIETNEGRIKGVVGNNNGVIGVQEAADAIADGSAALYGFQLNSSDAEAVADRLAGGNTWISKDDVSFSDAARDKIDGQGGGARDGRISKSEMAGALVRGGLAFGRDGITLSSEVRIDDRPAPPSSGSNRPAPPSSGYDRPAPPASGYDRPASPPSGYDRPTPPPVEPAPREPRYYWMPSFPTILPTERRQIPRIAVPPQPQPGPEPAPARRIEASDVKQDVFELLAEKGRLRNRTKQLFVTVHPKLTAGEAKNMLAAGKPIFVGPDGGMHGSGSYQQIGSGKQLESYKGEATTAKVRDLQDGEDRAYQGRVSSWRSDHQSRVRAWRDQDISTRLNSLPPLNSVYDTNRLMFNNYRVSVGGREFNRNLITVQNIYSQPETRRAIAQKWHENPDISTREFNMLVHSVMLEKLSSLGWNAQYQGDWGTYLGTNPVPGLRYPDTEDDVAWNANVIREVAVEVPMLLNSARLD